MEHCQYAERQNECGWISGLYTGFYILQIVEAGKYSKKVLLSEIAANDYNLNIPRYVDTFEAEDSIDVNAIAQNIKDLDASMADIDKTIAQFCKELNIETPF